jgi:hypothetical protein
VEGVFYYAEKYGGIYMTITLNNMQIISAMESASDLLMINLPIKTSWNITKNVKKFESAYKLYNECKDKIIQKYGVKDEDGKIKVDENNQIKIFPKYVEQCGKELEELNLCENEVDILTIKLSDLQDEDNKNKIKPATLFNLYFMIEDDETDN